MASMSPTTEPEWLESDGGTDGAVVADSPAFVELTADDIHALRDPDTLLFLQENAVRFSRKLPPNAVELLKGSATHARDEDVNLSDDGEIERLLQLRCPLPLSQGEREAMDTRADDGVIQSSGERASSDGQEGDGAGFETFLTALDENGKSYRVPISPNGTVRWYLIGDGPVEVEPSHSHRSGGCAEVLEPTDVEDHAPGSCPRSPAGSSTGEAVATPSSMSALRSSTAYGAGDLTQARRRGASTPATTAPLWSSMQDTVGSERGVSRKSRQRMESLMGRFGKSTDATTDGGLCERELVLSVFPSVFDSESGLNKQLAQLNTRLVAFEQIRQPLSTSATGTGDEWDSLTTVGASDGGCSRVTTRSSMVLASATAKSSERLQGGAAQVCEAASRRRALGSEYLRQCREKRKQVEELRHLNHRLERLHDEVDDFQFAISRPSEALPDGHPRPHAEVPEERMAELLAEAAEEARRAGDLPQPPTDDVGGMILTAFHRQLRQALESSSAFLSGAGVA